MPAPRRTKHHSNTGGILDLIHISSLKVCKCERDFKVMPIYRLASMRQVEGLNVISGP